MKDCPVCERPISEDANKCPCCRSSIPALGVTTLNATFDDARQIVRLSTSCWQDKRGAHIRRSLTTLRRLSVGHQLLDDECSNVGADEAVRMIVNLNESKDGIYEIIPCNESRDWETGIVDSYDLALIPFVGTAEKSLNK